MCIPKLQQWCYVYFLNVFLRERQLFIQTLRNKCLKARTSAVSAHVQDGSQGHEIYFFEIY